MVWLVRLVEQWLEIEADLPDRWQEARLELTLPDEKACARAAAVLAPAGAGRHGTTVRFSVVGSGAGVSADRIKRLLFRLDSERARGELKLVGAEEAVEAQPEIPVEPAVLAAAWTDEIERLPEDWSDALVEIDFVSSDLERAALLLSPLNPSRHDATPSFRCRVARTFGYGASPEMVRRCLARLDAERIRGTLRIVRVLSDTDPVATQGPVWYVGGRVV